MSEIPEKKRGVEKKNPKLKKFLPLKYKKCKCLKKEVENLKEEKL